MKNLIVSYFLCAAGLFTPLAGMHRFYLDKPLSGIIYLLTWGFFGIGTIIDLIRMPTLIEDRNLRLLFAERFGPDMLTPGSGLASPERAILKCAQSHQGVVTVPMVAIASGLSMAHAKTELDRLFKANFCRKDVDEDGNEIYEFKGLKPKKPLF